MGKQPSEIRPRVCGSVMRIHKLGFFSPFTPFHCTPGIIYNPLQRAEETFKYQYEVYEKLIWVEMRDIFWTNRAKSSTSNDITSLVPCLAVKGTNLMISRGFRWVDGSGYKMANGLSAYILYSSYSSPLLWLSSPSSPTEGSTPSVFCRRQMFHISRPQEAPMFEEFYNY